MIEVRLTTSLEAIPQNHWDGLDHGASCFLEFGFLRALELSESTGAESGWMPVYILAEEGGELVGAVASFIKTHSYGEYIFDWGWAQASEQAGLPYYPKLVIAAPVSPVSGPRLLLKPGCDRDAVREALVAGVFEVSEKANCSSIHWLFTTQEENRVLEDLGFQSRASFQFHWHNRDWQSFDDFLASMTSRRRKQIRRERRCVRESIDEVCWVPGAELSPEQLVALDRYYRSTVQNHWGRREYLRPGFFEHLQRLAPDRVLAAFAHQGGDTIAGALFLESESALYGRYWGCDKEVRFLHFELAYYAAIERCIRKKLPLFEAGAQGEHKLLRGFHPARTYSSHWFREPALAQAVSGFLRSEALEVEYRMKALTGALPFRSDGP